MNPELVHGELREIKRIQGSVLKQRTKRVLGKTKSESHFFRVFGMQGKWKN